MKPVEIGAFEAKTRLSELLERVWQGQTFVITRRGVPVAELRPTAPADGNPRFGCDKSKIVIHADFDAPIPELKDYTE